jgi:serine/threonine-protein kinase SRK2
MQLFPLDPPLAPGVANRDIKLENCLLHNEEGLPHPLLKLCDFGYSKADFRSAAKTQVGTLSYMAPEVVRSHGMLYDAKAADLWSSGVVLYIMLFGERVDEGQRGEGEEGQRYLGWGLVGGAETEAYGWGKGCRQA